jgi:DNA repair protein RecO (recombination protein O)
MNRTRIYRTEGIILKRSDWGEADRLITLFTPAFGKQRLLAPGARKPQSRKSGHLELFTCGLFVVARGRTFDKITQAETQDYFPGLHEALERAALASAAAELVDRALAEHDENTDLYDLLHTTLGRIADAPTPLLALRYFELQALTLLGYQPQVYTCVRCDNELAALDQFWSVAEGGVVCPNCVQGKNDALQALPLPLLKVLRLMQSQPWDVARSLRLPPETVQALEAILNRAIHAILERDLKSERFLREVRPPY